MERDDPLGDDEPQSRLLPPEDRLWRHPSEVGADGLSANRDRRGPAPRLWVVALLAGLTGALFTVGLMTATGNLRRILRVPVVERVALPASSLSPEAGPASPEAVEISRRLRPAIVGIEVEVEGIDRRIRGAGVVFRSDGHVLTNQHVVDRATRIVVVTADGRRSEARLVGADGWSDIAVVKVDDGLAVPVATMGTAAHLAVGQRVVAIGGFAGPGEPVVEVAVVGALGRQVDRAGAPALLDMIQTNATVAAASSGGALVDDTGAVVGITTALTPTGEARASGAGFATPIDWARAVADQLLATGTVVRVWLGVEGGDLDAGKARRMGVGGGAVVSLVRQGSPAGDAGLVADDVITSVDGVAVGSMGALRIVLRGHRPGDVVTLGVMRGPGTRAMDVQLAERPAQG